MKGEGCTICRYKGAKLALGWGMLVQLLLLKKLGRGGSREETLAISEHGGVQGTPVKLVAMLVFHVLEARRPVR